MTVTEQRPEVDESTKTDEVVDHFDSSGLAGTLGTGDHKALGRMYVLFGLVGGFGTLVLNLLVSLERTSIRSISVTDWGDEEIQTFFQVWSLSRTSLLFFCALPLIIGLATYVVPLQVGAPSIAFPRAAAAAFWGWLIGMGIHVATVLVDGGLGIPAAGVNSEAAQGGNPEAIELSLLSIGMVVLAVLLATVCIMVTVITQRPEGMTLYDVPLFSWSMLVAGGIWLLSLPVWLANLAVAWGDFRGEDAVLFGRVEEIWEQLAWLWSQPMVFAFTIPVLGIVGEIVPVAAGRRQRRYGTMQSVIAAFGMLTFGAWAQNYFNGEVTQQALFVIMSLLLIVPVLVFAGGVGETLAKGRPSMSGHLVLGMLSLITLLGAAALAGLHVLGSGIGVVREFDDNWLLEIIEPLEDLQGTVIATGVTQTALLASVIAGVAGIYYWGPKMFGRTLMTPIGALAALALVGGAVVLAVANVISGFLDEGDRPFEQAWLNNVWDADAIETFNIIGTAGSLLLIAGLGLVILDIIRVLAQGPEGDVDDPWGGHTLEWATTSPPPLGNFAEAPVVTSERPLLDAQEGDD
jgi:cytochrome c oxidase subunit 1